MVGVAGAVEVEEVGAVVNTKSPFCTRFKYDVCAATVSFAGWYTTSLSTPLSPAIFCR